MTKSEVSSKLSQKKKILFAFVVFMIVSSGCFLEVYVPSIQLSINQKMWETDQPATYFIKVRQRDGNGWKHWKTIVSDEVVLQTVAEVQTVDQIFSRLASDRVPRGYIYCGITFNPSFHYPAKALSYEGLYIEIEQFILCDKDVEACNSAMESE